MIYAATALLTALILAGLYHRYVVKPRRIIESGMDLLSAQDFNSRLRHVGQKDADRIIDIFNRMMEQLKENRLRVREQNHFLDLLIEASPMGVVQMDFEGHTTSLNPAARHFLANQELVQRIATLQEGETVTLHLSDSHIYRLARLSFIDHGFQHPFVLIESMTDEVRKAENKAYKQVVRMIAHEVNNTVAGITSSLESISEELKADTDIAELMRVCIDRSYAMSRFITRFADVVKIPEPTLQSMDVCEHLDTCLRSMETLCQDITIRRQYEPLILQADPILMEQLFVNIIKNAIESIDGKGTITLTTTSHSIEISDDGDPITAETESHLFTPFYSSKPNGQGIGLIFVREVLTRHGFSFSLKTESNGLTVFKICF
ncbi:ATPase/histidine kinase/DNA gyrase B/HSP90 domain protein [Prevotella sp. DNF00663]|uniref:sensor histidine kinase n=1 Tax=unclassified Prevotella TaxID=2638335 RepID=UPI000561267E